MIWAWIIQKVTTASVKFWGILVAVVTVVAWLFTMRRDAQKLGAQKVKDQIRTETEKVDDKWREIDSSDPSLDDAIDELRSPRGHR